MIILTVLALMIAGWLAGSLLNYLTDTLVQTRRLRAPQCLRCSGSTGWQYYLLMKPCRSCNANVPVRNWTVQILSMAGMIALWFFPPQKLGFWIALPVLFYFALILIMDISYRVIMHPVSIAGAIVGLAIGLWLNPWYGSIIGGIAGFGIMFGLYYLGVLFSKGLSKMRGEAIEEVALGFGDVNLSGVLGLMLGWPRIGVGLVAAIVVAGLFSGLYLLGMVIAKRYQAFTAIPYAPFLILMATVFIYMAE